MRRIAFAALLLVPLCGFAQEGIRLPDRGEPGLDPRFAPRWLAPDVDRFGFAQYQWRDAAGFAPSRRMNWSYSFSERGSLGMSYGTVREFDAERQVGLFGRYWLSNDWALSAESMSPQPGSLFRLQDFRIGVHRRF